ncbi:hypothetical protein HJC23_000259 [Cyclotella cryptica]|uniref:t-SNARE coiled-coil homology domain-containing protein n=1 Tax=Cyclotella cryptica TaxID=29204 RepID=A0ABD3QCR7_9STRA
MFLDVSSSLDAQNVNIDTQDVKIDTQNAKIDAQNAKIDSLNAKIVDQNSKIELKDCFTCLLERIWVELMAGQKNWGG